MNEAPKKPKLTRKQMVFVKELLDNPKQSATSAALAAYDTNRDVARRIATENLSKPVIQSYLLDHAFEAESTVVEHMKQRNDKRLSFDAARDVLDRVHGKATQRTEISTNAVVVTIDLSGMSLDSSDTEGT